MKAQLLLAAVGLFTTGFALAQGPLTPPATPAPTMKTLTEVEPRIAINAANTPGDADSLFKITQPGSYYLTGNISGVANKDGIEIAASGVTLDLNGFDLLGVTGSSYGVRAGSLTNIAVVNGSVRNWGIYGVYLGNASNSCLEGVRASGNLLGGIYSGSRGTITNCSADGNTEYGIVAFPGSTVTNCSASNNTGYGIYALSGSTVTNCTASNNTGDGIYALSGSTVTNCSASNNNGDGIETGTGSTVTNCTAYDNTGNGIQVGSGCSVTDSSAYSNNNFGILSASGCRISNCTLNSNYAHGISTGSDTTITGCTTRTNGYHGIIVTADCVINGNTCNDNGTLADITGAGIHTTGVNNRIEGNNCSNNERGIECPAGSTGNFIIRNSASKNTINFVFVANNGYGNILDITGTTVAVSGNSATGTLATSDPHANFRY